MFSRNEQYTVPLDCDVNAAAFFLNVPPVKMTPLPAIPANCELFSVAALFTEMAVLGLSPPVHTASPIPEPPKLPLL